MEHDLDQLAEAITIASNPSQGTLHNQALEYLQTVQQNAPTTWRAALTLFVETGVDGTRKYTPSVRFFALRILEDFLENRCVLNDMLHEYWADLTPGPTPWITNLSNYFDNPSFHTSRRNTCTALRRPVLPVSMPSSLT